MLTRRQLIVAKAEYLNGGPLTDKELSTLLRKIHVGNMKELRDYIPAHKNDFIPIEKVVASKIVTDTTSHEDLKDIIKEIAIKSTSVNSGIRMLAVANMHSRTGLMKYIYNLYVKDALRRDKKIKKHGAGREPILNHEPLLTEPHNSDPAWSYLSFYNPDQENNPTKQDEYDSKGQYLKNEEKLDMHPSHTEPKKEVKKEKRLRKYIPNIIGRPGPSAPQSPYGNS